MGRVRRREGGRGEGEERYLGPILIEHFEGYIIFPLLLKPAKEEEEEEKEKEKEGLEEEEKEEGLEKEGVGGVGEPGSGPVPHTLTCTSNALQKSC